MNGWDDFIPAAPTTAAVSPQAAPEQTNADSQSWGDFIPAVAPEPSFSQQVGAGLNAAYHDVTDWPSEEVTKGLDKLGVTRWLGQHGLTIENANELAATHQNDQAQFNQKYGNSTVAQGTRIAADVLPALAGGAGAEGLGVGMARAVPGIENFLTAAPRVGNVLALAGRGALQGAGAQLAVSGQKGPTAKSVEESAIGGAVGAPILAGAGKAIGSGVNALRGPALDPETALLAKRAGDLGIPLGGAQISSSPAVHYLNSALKYLPFTGYGARDAAQQEGFNRALAKGMGVDAPKITPAVMAQAKATLGAKFDELADKIPIKADDKFVNDLDAIQTAASKEMVPSELKPINAQIDNVLGAVDKDGTISGKQYQALTRKGTPLDRALNSNDPNIRHWASQVRGALDDAMERSAPEDLRNELSQTRAKYKVMKTIEPLAEKSPTGDISPALLMQQVRNHYGDLAYGGGGDMGDLARIGQRFLKEPPNSGTAQRSYWNSLVGGGLGAAGATSAMMGGADMGLPILSAVGHAAVGLPVASGVAAALNSKAYRNALIQRALGEYPEWKRALMAGGNALVKGGNRAAIPAAIVGGNALQ